MNRREALKGLAVLSLMGILPKSFMTGNTPKTYIHFIGLGGGGCNALEFIYKKGVRAKYTCISSPFRQYLPKEIRFIKFESPKMFFTNKSGIKMYLPEEINNIFIPGYQYILLTGLGGYTGTNLIKAIMDKFIIEKKEFKAICNLPFNFEGTNRRTMAMQIVSKYDHLDNFWYFESEKLRKECKDKTVAEVFRNVNERFYNIYIKHLA